MARFEIQGPDGKSYEIEAPDMQSAVAALQSFAGPSGGVSVNKGAAADFKTNLANVPVGLREGMSLGFADEISGATRGALMGQVPGREGSFNYDVPIGERYSGIRDQERALLNEARTQSPGAMFGSEVIGGIAPSLLMGTANTVRGAAGLGAIEGGLLGLGSADGRDLMQQGLLGAATGSALAAAAKPIVAGAKALGRGVTAPAGGVIDAISGSSSQRRANNVINRTLSRSGMSVDDVTAQAQRAIQQGQPQIAIADILGGPGQGTLSGVARTPGAGSAEIRDFLQSRQSSAGDRMGSFLAEGFDATDTAAQRAAQLTNQRSAQAATDYAAARGGAEPVDVRGALGVIDSRLGQIAGAEQSGFSGDGIDSVFKKYRSRLAGDKPAGDVSAIELSDFGRTLGVKQDLADDISSALRAGRNNEARELLGVQRELDAALEAASPSYRQANDRFAQASRAIEAIDTGASATSSRARAPDTIAAFQAMSPDEQAAFRAGMGDRLIGKSESQPSGANRALPLMRDKTQAEIRAIANDPNLLLERIARENTMAETRQRAIGGSMTADNLANIEDAMPFDIGMVSNLLSGRWGAAGAQMAQKGANALTGRNEATQQLIARILLSNDPEKELASLVRQNAISESNSEILRAAVRAYGNRADQPKESFRGLLSQE